MSQPKIRLVWVRREYDRRDCPGIVHTWQQRDGVWWAFVTMVLDEVAFTEWVVGSSLVPVKARPNVGSMYD